MWVAVVALVELGILLFPAHLSFDMYLLFASMAAGRVSARGWVVHVLQESYPGLGKSSRQDHIALQAPETEVGICGGGGIRVRSRIAAG